MCSALTRVMLFENPRKLIVARSSAPASDYGYAGFAIGWTVRVQLCAGIAVTMVAVVMVATTG